MKYYIWRVEWIDRILIQKTSIFCISYWQFPSKNTFNFLFISNSLWARHFSTFATINFPDCQMIRTFSLFLCVIQTYLPCRWRLGSWKRKIVIQAYQEYLHKKYVLKIDSLNFSRHEQMRCLEFLRIFTSFKAQGCKENYTPFFLFSWIKLQSLFRPLWNMYSIL